MDKSMETFANKQLKLLELERNAELQSYSEIFEKNSSKTLERMGFGLYNLVITEHCIGMFGRHIITLAKIHHGSLGNPALKTGDVVNFTSLSESKNKQPSNDEQSGGTIHINSSCGVNATVTKLSANTLTITCDSLPSAVFQSYSSNFQSIKDLCVTKMPSDVTYKRLNKVAKRVSNGFGKNGVKLAISSVLTLLFKDISEDCNHTEISHGGAKAETLNRSPELSLFNMDLNETQKECVGFCLAQKHLAIVHGPPGTGKTTTIVEYILHEISRGNKVLACAPSNVAVDNLVTQLFKFKKEAPGLKMTRLGHPARASETSKLFTIDSKILESDFSDVIRDLRHEILKAKQTLSVQAATSTHDSDFKEASRKLPGLKKDLRQLEEKCIKELIENSNVVLSTCSSAHEDGTFRLLDSKDLELFFDVCVIDECGQAIEVESWIPLLNAKKLVIAGDHQQLPPTVMSQDAEKQGLSISLLERMVATHPDLVKLLDIQYRMNNIIMNWASEQFYQGKLKFGTAEVENRSLENLLNFSNPESLGENEFLLNCGMMLIDTDGCDMYELESANEESKGNEAEADLVAYHVKTLLKIGIPQREIAVISPYNLQLELIKSRISQQHPNIEVRSVDGFQGREKEAIVLSLVRSNPNFEIGFLSESRRLNVAITRAKRHVCVICDSQTIKVDKTLSSMVEYISQNGVAFTAADYLEKPDMEWSFTNKESSENPSKSRNKFASKKEPLKTGGPIMRTDKNGDTYFDKKALLIEIDQFLAKNQRKEMKFPKSLPAAARAFVHDEAEKRGLKHASVGTGSNRRIVLTKVAFSTNGGNAEVIIDQNDDHDNEAIAEEEELEETAIEERKELRDTDSHCSSRACELNQVVDSNPEIAQVSSSDSNILTQRNLESNLKGKFLFTDEFMDEPEEKDAMLNLNDNNAEFSSMQTIDQKSVLCSICFKNIPEANLETHVLHCAKLQKAKLEKTKQSGKSAPKKTFKEKTKSKIDNLGDDDFEELCDAFQQLNSVCNEPKCKTSIVTLFFKCNYCDSAFCSMHRCPENHGCNREDVKRKARQNMRDPPPPVMTSRQENSARLHGKMKDKIDNMRQSRNTKRGSRH